MEVVSISIAIVAALFGLVSRSIVQTLVVRNRLLRNRNDLQIVTAAGKKINILASDLNHQKVQEIVSSAHVAART